MSGPISLNVPSVLQRAAEGLHSVADGCSGQYAAAMRDRAKEMDAACVAVAELITADREHDTTREALLSLNRRIAEDGWIEVEHDALRVAGQKFVAAQIRRARALERIAGGAA